MRKINENKTIFGIMFFICIYMTLYKMGFVTTPYSVFSVILSSCLYLMFVKQNFFLSKKENKLIFITSFLFSFLYVLGGIVLSNMRQSNIDIFSLFFNLDNLFFIISYFILFSVLLNHIFDLIKNYTFKGKTIINSKKLFAVSFIIIFLLWLPYFLNYFPGSLTPDSIEQITQVLGINSLSDHHPIAHTLLISMIFKPIYSLTSNMNIAIAGFIIFQMLIMSLTFSLAITYLGNKKVSKKILILVLLYYSISPIFGYYSITVWKDIIFGGIFLLLTIFILILIDKKQKLESKDFIYFIILSILFVFFRNNAIYIYLFILPFFILSFKNYKKQFGGAFLSIITFYFIIKVFVFPVFGITKSSSSEYIAIPLQQVGRMVFKDVTFSKEENELLEELMPIDKMKSAYNPYVSDGIKFNPEFNIKNFNKNKKEYLKLYLKLIFKHPKIAIEAYAISTVGYWYPDFKNWAAAKDIYVGSYEKIKINRNSLLKNRLDTHFDRIESRELPIFGMQWSIGLAFWIISVTFIFQIATKRTSNLLVYSLVFGLWMTMMIASPVQGEFRYVFSAFTTLPIYLILPIISKKEVKNDDIIKKNK